MRASDPTCVAARPTPWAPSITSRIQSTCSRSCVVELGDRERLRPQHGVAHLAHVGERRLAALALLGGLLGGVRLVARLGGLFEQVVSHATRESTGAITADRRRR